MCPESLFRQRLPFRGATFKALREEGRFYADKTRVIAGLAASKRKFLFTRPAGFGKSLLLSTFEALFRDGIGAFHGLDIERSWSDRTYDVVRLDFSEAAGFATEADFREQFDRMIVKGFARAGFGPEGGADVVMEFGEWLRSRPARSLVLLIDDYDAPLAAALGDEALFKAVWSRLEAFFIRTKSCAEVFRFFFMTGEAKFTWAGPFGGFNDVIDISADPEFAGLAGLAEAELREGFGEILAAVARKLGLAVDEVVERLRERCGGYCFDDAGMVRLFRPASVIACLREAERKGVFPARESGEFASRLLPLIRARVREDAAWHQGAWFLPAFSLDMGISRRSDMALLLFQAGLLSVEPGGQGFLELRCPNQETAAAMNSLAGG